MSLPNPLQLTVTATGAKVASTTLASTADYNATEADSIVLSTNTNVLGVSETVTVQVVTSDNSTRVLSILGAGAYQLTNGLDAFVLPGGFYYRFAKTATVAATGLDVSVKPRIGFSGA